jgi:biopolymer transport protein TolQ
VGRDLPETTRAGEARSNADSFEKEFWSGGDLTGLYRRISGKGGRSAAWRASSRRAFASSAGCASRTDLQASQVVDGSRRAMLVSQMRESDRLEQNLAFLATVGSTSPYVGLFGTVWGIMNSFIALGNVQQATLAMVAPGIAEALIATAMGLFAAIPAVIAYNRYADTVGRLESRYDTFMEEFSTILQRHARRAVES